MIYIGNFESWINEDFINKILLSNGDRRPAPGTKEETSDLQLMWKEANYQSGKISWEMYYESHLGKFKPPIEITGVYEHWFCKMNPGDMLPLHDDRYEGKKMQDIIESGKTIKRYWMACQDMLPGHVFSYENQLLDNYRAGDLFEFTIPDALHGSCNIGFVPKISYQLTVVF